MNNEQHYQSWKQCRANIDVPDGFSDRVTTSVHKAQQIRWMTTAFLLQNLVTFVCRSRIAQASICSVGIGLWFIRIGALFTIFIPR